MYYVKYKLSDNKLVGCHYNKGLEDLSNIDLTDENENLIYGVDEITKAKFEQIQSEGLDQFWN